MEGEQGEKILINVVRERTQWERNNQNNENEYVNSVSLSICPSVEVLKPISLLIKLSPRTRGPKNYLGPRVLTPYFYFYVRFHAATTGGPYFLLYFYVCFRAATAVVDGGGIFGIWRVSEEIWVRFFWAKGLGGS